MADRAKPDDPQSTPQRTLSVWRPPGNMASAQSMERPRAPDGSQKALSTAPTSPASGPSPDAEGPLPVGSVIGQRYVIEQHISSGGFGAVYRASDREISHHQVALKLLHRAAASTEEREAALRELMLIATVSHPSVVQFKDYGWYEGRLWFAMPWYRGKTLDAILGVDAAAVPMTRPDARVLFSRIAQGLAAMHAVGIHHHDIKPENIFVAEIAGFPGGLPVLLDLGIATQRGENPKGLTVEYASPETAAAMLGSYTKPIGGAADVYSLALVLRNALDPTAATPVRTNEVLPLLLQRSQEPVALSKARELAFLAPYFRRWLSLDPLERPTASELADELSVLTEPEERRAARMRLLKRIVPIVVVAGLMIAALVVQLRQQKTVLTVQGKALEAERQSAEVLRKRSETQLAEIESQAKKLGNERQQLEQTLGIARRLNVQLAESSKRGDELKRRVDRVTGERDDLTQDKQRLTTERDELLAQRTALTGERDRAREVSARLSQERDGLVAERDRLVAERDRLDRERATEQAGREVADRRAATLAVERDRLVKDNEKLIQQRDKLQSERAQLSADNATQDKEVRTMRRERDAALARQRELEREVEQLRAENRRLMQQKPREQIKIKPDRLLR